MNPWTLHDRTPELRSTFRFVLNLRVGAPWRIRAIWTAMGLVPMFKVPHGVRLEVADLGPDARVRVFTPAGGGSGAALLFIHGGGMVIGTASQEDSRCANPPAPSDIAAETLPRLM